MKLLLLVVALEALLFAPLDAASVRGNALSTRQLQGMNVLTGLDLINAQTETKHSTLVNNQVVVVSSIPGMVSPNFNINATYNLPGLPGNVPIQSVVFELNGVVVQTENAAPWAFCGNSGPNYSTCGALGYGTHTVKATPCSGKSGSGTKGAPLTVTFSIVATPPVAPVTKAPTKAPVTKAPTKAPVTKAPTSAPVTKAPTSAPTKAPATKAPVTKTPTKAPVTKTPTKTPVTKAPTKDPTKSPTKEPTKAPIPAPTKNPTGAPVKSPTLAPVPAPVPVADIPVLDLTLMYTGSPSPHQSVMNLVLNAVNVIDLKTLNVPTASFSINAIRTSALVQSVAFNNGQNENGLPWAYCGNQGTNFYNCGNLIVGATVTIVVTPFTGSWQSGTALTPVTTTVQIIDTRTKAPTVAPVAVAPTAMAVCPLPQWLGNWTSSKAYPIGVAEAGGAMVGTTLVIVSGFNTWQSTVLDTYGRDTSTSNSNWVRYDDQPVAIGTTHSGFVVVNNKFYMCGGYVGANNGPISNICMVLDISQPSGQQWSTTAVPPLPEGHGGGGMVYDTKKNALIVAGGALRFVNNGPIIDTDNTWMYSFDTPSVGWVEKAPIPYTGNHISFVTAKDADGVEHHYFNGGQHEEKEYDGNKVDHVEYIAETDRWVRRQNLPVPRGHASSSTRPYGCGYILMGGCTNGGGKIKGISYYHIPTNTWSAMGEMAGALNTPVCDINRSNNKMYCQTGYVNGGKYNHERQLAPL